MGFHNLRTQQPEWASTVILGVEYQEMPYSLHRHGNEKYRVVPVYDHKW